MEKQRGVKCPLFFWCRYRTRRAGRKMVPDAFLTPMTSDKPGLGVELNHEVLRKHLSKENRFIALFKPGWETPDQYSD